MRTLARAVQSTHAIGTRLHLPWRHLDRAVFLSTRELVIMAGAPGGGKSTFAINLAMQVPYPALYVAQDSPASVVARMAALGVDVETAQARDLITSDRAALAARLENVRPTLVFERGAKTVEQINDSVVALTEWIGYAPPMVFIDNLIDLIVPGYTPTDMGFFSTALPALKQMANDLDTTVMVLHHVVRSGDSRKEGRGRSGIKMSDLLYAGEREARHVWGLYNDGEERITVQVLKQQDGPADPEGGLEFNLRWYPKAGKLMPDMGA